MASVLQVLTRVRADDDGISSRNQLGRGRRLDWSQVARFEVRDHRPTPGARTFDGRRVRLMPFGNHGRRATECLDELETYQRKQEQALS